MVIGFWSFVELFCGSFNMVHKSKTIK